MKEYRSTIINKRTNEIVEMAEYSRVSGYSSRDFKCDIDNMLWYAAQSYEYGILQMCISYPGRLSHLVYDMVTRANGSNITADLFINNRFYKSYKIAY